MPCRDVILAHRMGPRTLPPAGFRSIFLFYLNLIKSVTYIHDGKAAPAIELREDVVWLLRDYNMLVHVAIFAPWPPRALGLVHHHDGRAPLVQHLIL